MIAYHPTISNERSFLNVYDAVIFNCSRHTYFIKPPLLRADRWLQCGR
jgi:hypothetical protein